MSWLLARIGDVRVMVAMRWIAVCCATVAFLLLVPGPGCSTPNGSAYESARTLSAKTDALVTDMKAFRTESAETHKLMRELSVKMDQNTKLLCLALERAGEKK